MHIIEHNQFIRDGITSIINKINQKNIGSEISGDYIAVIKNIIPLSFHIETSFGSYEITANIIENFSNKNYTNNEEIMEIIKHFELK